MLLQNRVALITGSGRGIGRAIARLFANEGAHVFLTARTEAELAAAAREINAASPAPRTLPAAAAYITADLTQEKDCSKLFLAAKLKFGCIDILINNAGHYGPVG